MAQPVMEAFRRQDCYYSLSNRAPTDHQTRVIASIIDAHLLTGQDGSAAQLIARSAISVVTLTITEKGYPRTAGGGDLATNEPIIAHDLAATQPGADIWPRSALGTLAFGLAARFAANQAPLTVVSCDNMSSNGPTLARLINQFIALSGWPERAKLLSWLDQSVAFPATIVDRIVPATTAADRLAAEQAIGLRDDLPVFGEPYRQWVLEDSFRGPRPYWEAGGASFVADVTPFELTKLRLLNGSHSALAYLGLAAGYATVADVMNRSTWGETLVRGLAGEMALTLPPDGPHPAAYTAALISRFANPAMAHRLQQIGSDGSLKLPERWVNPMRQLLARPLGSAPSHLTLAFAAWINATKPGPDGRQVYGTSDPLTADLARCWQGQTGQTDLAKLTGVTAAALRLIGAPDLAEDLALTRQVAGLIPAVAAGQIPL
jgi:fructuronate reductase